MLPPSLHYTRPNPNIDFAGSPFRVVDRLTDWPNGSTPRRAGVSSFGIGGTNAHVVVEEAPATVPSEAEPPWHLLLVSAKTSTALDRATQQLGEFLERSPDVSLADVEFTLQVGRQDHGHRRMLLVARGGTADAAVAMRELDPGRLATGIRERPHRPIVFMFPGQGAQYPGMARQLYLQESFFKDEIDRCCDFLAPPLGFDLRELLVGAADGPASGSADTSDAATRLAQTMVAQPALFCVEYALARLWMEWGIKPQAMVGHSVGELVAACLAGVFTVEDALTLVATRGRLMQGAAPGAMVAIHAAAAEIGSLLGPELSLAAINGPSACVASGPFAAIGQLEAALAERRIPHQRLRTSHAFHSSMFETLVAPFVEAVAKTPRKPPKLPYLSNLTGGWITPDMAIDPEYWGRHLRQTVLFARNLEELTSSGRRVLLEVGPGTTLTTLASQIPGATGAVTAIASLPRAQDREADLKNLLNGLGRMWVSGAEVNWKAFYSRKPRNRVALPTYPFERQRYWVERQPLAAAARVQTAHGRAPISKWFYVPDWRPTTDSVPPAEVVSQAFETANLADPGGPDGSPGSPEANARAPRADRDHDGRRPRVRAARRRERSS